jgi:hypothetical protein
VRNDSKFIEGRGLFEIFGVNSTDDSFLLKIRTGKLIRTEKLADCPVRFPHPEKKIFLAVIIKIRRLLVEKPEDDKMLLPPLLPCPFLLKNDVIIQKIRFFENFVFQFLYIPGFQNIAIHVPVGCQIQKSQKENNRY